MKADFIKNISTEYDTVRIRHAGKQQKIKWLTIGDARENRMSFDWASHTPIRPKELGITVFEDYSLDELAEGIDWTPFFIAWELAGKYPRILSDEVVGEEATRLFNDAKAMVKKIVNEKWFSAKGIFGLFPANSIGC